MPDGLSIQREVEDSNLTPFEAHCFPSRLPTYQQSLPKTSRNRTSTSKTIRTLKKSLENRLSL